MTEVFSVIFFALLCRMIENQVSLKNYNTFGIDVKAREFSTFSTVEELKSILNQRNKSLPVIILGGGSNVLFTKDVEALVLKNEINGITAISEDDESISFKVGAGVVWHSFVQYTVERKLGGIENLSLIPGSVGASPMQNIGAYGVEIKDVFVSLEAFHIDSLEVHTFTNKACQFGYRESVFKRKLKNQYVIVSVTYRLMKNPVLNTNYGAIQQEIQSLQVEKIDVSTVSQAVINIRQSKLPDPTKIGNAGSFFKNPVVKSDVFFALRQKFPNIPNYPQENGDYKLAAGWLIEQIGYKGKKAGNCGVHDLQALVLVNYGAATGKEIYDLSSEIISEVKRVFNVELEREVNIY